MRKCLWPRLLWTCLLPLGGIVFGQSSLQSLAFETINDKKGLSHHIIHSLLQDSRGFLWIGTGYGLNRYDGVACTPFFAKPGTPNTLPDNHINQMAEDKAGNLWIGTARGIGRLNLLTGSIDHYFTTEAHQLTHKSLNFNIFSDREGRIWAANGYFLLLYNPAQNDFRAFEVDCGQSTGFTRNFYVLDLMQDSKGRVWLATSYGVKLFNPGTGQFVSYHFPEKGGRRIINAITGLAEAPDGRIYAGTWGEGMLVFEEASNRFAQVSLPDFPLASEKGQMIMDIAFSNGHILLGTVLGLVTAKYPECVKAGPGARYAVYRADPQNLRSLPGQVVNRILTGRFGNIWIATDHNLARADLRMTQFQHLPVKGASGETLLPSAAVGHTGVPGETSWWMGATGLYFAKNGQMSPREMGVSRLIANGEVPGVIWDMHRGLKYLWLASTNGLIAYDAGKGAVARHYKGAAGDSGAFSGNRLWRVYEDRKGRVWVGTIRMGVGMLDPATGRIRNFFYRKEERGSMFNVTPSGFFEDKDGDIWFGGVDFLYHYQARADSIRVIPFAVKNMAGETLKGLPQPFFQDKEGEIWLAFADGLARIEKRTATIRPLLLHVPYFRPTGKIVVKNQRRIWFGTTTGLFRLDTAGMRITRFTTRDGLMSNETDGCLALLADGSMITGFSGTLTRFSPDGLEAVTTPPPLAFARVQVNGRDTLAEGTATMKLPYRSTIQFDFAALSFGNAEQNSYRYRLLGADKDWNPPTDQRRVTYAQLQPGSYTFEVKGSNSDGVWNENPLTYHFIIGAPFYLQGWFLLTALLSVAGLAFLWYRYRLQQGLKLERLRTRLATDLHDDVGATLSAISMYADALKRQISQPQVAGLLGKIGEDSREMVRTMSDLVWAINPKNDSGIKLVQRMENLATDLCAAAEVKLIFDRVENVSDYTPGIEVRRNIYLIFKEALNNALKYANCTTLRVEVIQKQNQFSLTLFDDGIGFDPRDDLQGNGLGNMQERAREIGGNLTLEAAPGKGCRVLLVCPL